MNETPANDRPHRLTHERLRDAPMTLHFKMAARTMRSRRGERADGRRARREREKKRKKNCDRRRPRHFSSKVRLIENGPIIRKIWSKALFCGFGRAGVVNNAMLVVQVVQSKEQSVHQSQCRIPERRYRSVRVARHSLHLNSSLSLSLPPMPNVYLSHFKRRNFKRVLKAFMFYSIKFFHFLS